jgi:hypothetical protein
MQRKSRSSLSVDTPMLESLESDASVSGAVAPLSVTTRLLFGLFGFGLLAPWNFVLNSLVYFIGLYGSSGVGGNIAFWITLAYTYPGIIFQVALVSLGARAGSEEARIVSSAALQAAALVAVALLAPLSPWVPIALMLVLGACTAVMQASLSGVATRFPAAASGAFMLGQGVVGVVSSALQILVKAAVASGDGGESPPVAKAAAIGYFVAAAAIMGACGAAYWWLERLPEARPFLITTAAPAAAPSGEDESEGASLIEASGGALGEEADGGQQLCSPALWQTMRKTSVYTAALGMTFVITFSCVNPHRRDLHSRRLHNSILPSPLHTGSFQECCVKKSTTEAISAPLLHGSVAMGGGASCC